ncbi:MAG: TetR/AcrR family transcriptional regulator [Boseongicola sp.]
MPWEKTYDSAEVIDRAKHAFWGTGYEATSISNLLDATGLNRGSLYAEFGDKRGLFLEALRAYDANQREAFLGELAANNAPLEAVAAAFSVAAEVPKDGVTPTGCLLVNTALELAPHDPEVRAFIKVSFAAVEQFFADRLHDAKRRGELKACVDPDTAAKTLLGMFLGLRVLTRSGADASARRAIVTQATTLIA